MSLESALLTAVSVLTTVVVSLSGAVTWLALHLFREVNDCKKDRRLLWAEIRKLYTPLIEDAAE